MNTKPAIAQPKSFAPKPNWRLLLGLLMSAGILALVVFNRSWLLEALSLARGAQMRWLAAALAVIFFSYLISGQVFRVALRRQGYQLGTLHAWFTALVAIIISQSMPAGGVGSYAFLVGTFRRRGVSIGQTALVATLEMLSYSLAMVLIAIFSLVYLTLHTLATGASSGLFVVPLLIGLGVLAALVAGVLALTQSPAALTACLRQLQSLAGRISRRAPPSEWVPQVAERVANGRALLIDNWRTLALLVLIQLVALCGHSLAMLLILLSLGVHASFAVVLAAFGAALVTSLFNVLPGGGGTIETILAAVLGFLAVGPAAVPAAVIFRLLNFWLLLPVAALAYAWLMRAQTPARR